jgi:hypothetical protein
MQPFINISTQHKTYKSKGADFTVKQHDDAQKRIKEKTYEAVYGMYGTSHLRTYVE